MLIAQLITRYHQMNHIQSGYDLHSRIISDMLTPLDQNYFAIVREKVLDKWSMHNLKAIALRCHF